MLLTPPRRLQSLGGLTGLIEQNRKRFGDPMGFRLVIYPDYAVMDRADPNDERHQLSYTYRAGPRSDYPGHALAVGVHLQRLRRRFDHLRR